jgi:hypothetical protein
MKICTPKLEKKIQNQHELSLLFLDEEVRGFLLSFFFYLSYVMRTIIK